MALNSLTSHVGQIYMSTKYRPEDYMSISFRRLYKQLFMVYSRPMLETFLAVCKHGNFSQAAVALHKSQSCVSMQITHIERELGLPLLDRSARPLTLTDAGMKFLEFAKAILRTIDECSGYMKDMAAGSVGELKIGTSTSTGPSCSHRYWRTLSKRFRMLAFILMCSAGRQYTRR